ncbi:MAG: DUF3854 domain-containing protein, partial [Oscillospiraceae bacterium]|nr:DUF3854 domain-containing protein [Oscillospiraceae bacterium]
VKEMGYNYIDVVDTAIVCNLEIKPVSVGHPEVVARCPFCNDRKYRMYLSRERDNPTYYCHNCGTGGNAVTLYARIFGLATKDSYLALMNNPNVAKIQNDYIKPQSHELKPLEQRHAIYLELLEMLSLKDEHRKNLRERGLSEKLIEGNMYRSMPDDYKREEIASRLADRYDLTGMPGFFTKNCRWKLYGKPGILIPVCTKDNLIQGLQVRLDDVSDKKFRWLSTNGFENGTKIYGFMHMVGDITSDTLYITEGPLKADVASYLAGGALFVGLTGVKAVGQLAELIRSVNPRRIVECIDMDKLHNPHVREALNRIQSIAMPLCEEYKPFYWSEEWKGIDDYLLFKQKSRYLQGNEN